MCTRHQSDRIGAGFPKYAIRALPGDGIDAYSCLAMTKTSATAYEHKGESAYEIGTAIPEVNFIYEPAIQVFA